MNDNEIREFFHANRPVVGGADEYAEKLSARMDAIAEIKALHDESIRSARTAVLLTFLVGAVIGAAAIAFILLRPVMLPQLNTSIIVSISSFVEQWKYLLVILVAAAAIAASLLPRRKSGSFL